MEIKKNKSIFKIKFLRNIILASLAMAILLPLYNIFIAYPSFIKALTKNAEQESIHTAQHLMSMLFSEQSRSDKNLLTINPNIIKTVIKDHNLKNIKVFLPSGENIYSIDQNDIGTINKKNYFHEIVARGKNYTKFTRKGHTSAEGQFMKVDIVETYVPIMKGNKFFGAFEIYTDITEIKERFNMLRLQATFLVIILAFGFVALIFVTSSRARETLTAKDRAEEKTKLQLNRLNILRLIEKAVTSSLDLRVTLDIVIEQVTTQLHIDAATILLLDEKTQVLKYIVSKGFRTDALKYTKLKLGESNAGRSAIERRIVTISNLKEKIDGFTSSKQFGDEDFITYIALPLIAKNQVKGVLELFHRYPLSTEPDWLEFLENIADQAAIAIDNADLFDKLTLAYDSTIEGWSRAMDMRDKETEGHTLRVTEMTLRIARKFRIKDEELLHIKRGALLHDMGKMGIPDSILLKPDHLTDEERKIMKRHPEYAYELLYQIEYLRPALDIPYYHHERWDGSGYPRGLKEEEIPLAARIFAVVDVWDALCSDRPYRPAWPKDKAREYIRSNSGIHFDPKVVEVFLKMDL